MRTARPWGMRFFSGCRSHSAIFYYVPIDLEHIRESKPDCGLGLSHYEGEGLRKLLGYFPLDRLPKFFEDGTPMGFEELLVGLVEPTWSAPPAFTDT